MPPLPLPDTMDIATECEGLPQPIDMLKQGLAGIFSSTTHSDCIIICGHKSWNVHKVLLSAQSDYFRHLLESQYSDVRRCMIDLTAIKSLDENADGPRDPEGGGPGDPEDDGPESSEDENPGYPETYGLGYGEAHGLGYSIAIRQHDVIEDPPDPVLTPEERADADQDYTRAPEELADNSPQAIAYMMQYFYHLDYDFSLSFGMPEWQARVTNHQDILNDLKMFWPAPIVREITEVQCELVKKAIAHAVVFATAVKFGVPGLQTLSSLKFKHALAECEDCHGLAVILRVVYSFTPKDVRDLRVPMLDALLRHPDLLDTKEMERVTEDIPRLLLESSRRFSRVDHPYPARQGDAEGDSAPAPTPSCRHPSAFSS
nr:hypothetical protein CFP56_31639 [Quercus suber]